MKSLQSLLPTREKGLVGVYEYPRSVQIHSVHRILHDRFDLRALLLFDKVNNKAFKINIGNV